MKIMVSAILLFYLILSLKKYGWLHCGVKAIGLLPVRNQGSLPILLGQFVLVSSDDDGKTWSAPYNITSQVKDPKWHLYFNGPGNGIAMKNGVLVFPSQYWDESKKPGIPHSAIVYSEDNGKTWKSGQVPNLTVPKARL
jgi:hypothetical protein